MCDDSVTSDTHDMDYIPPGLDVAALPKGVKNRIKALKKLQFETVKSEEMYYKEIHALDLKYQKIYDEINDKRHMVISGKHEPAGDELDWPSDDESEDDKKEKGDDISDEVQKICINDDFKEDPKGIPKFWYYAIRAANEEILMGQISPFDEPVLEYLTNITVTLSNPENTGFTLHFHFADNEYFSNNVLTKEYTLRPGHDTECPLEYDGPEIFKATGCKIDWKEGKDITKKTVPVVEKPKKGKEKHKDVVIDSFFNFFSPPEMPKEEGEEMSDEDKATLAVDFDVGFAIKEKLVPRAVLYFTGEAVDDEDYEDCSDEEDDDDDEDED